jgi:hypothetical protein
MIAPNVPNPGPKPSSLDVASRRLGVNSRAELTAVNAVTRPLFRLREAEAVLIGGVQPSLLSLRKQCSEEVQ